ncbi:hypothetical protein BDQ17DRAFT_1237828 [Cyathus striatus]|nr:hypothetical protein BDQ17DRAFT_1237828 [Cyathus striatus]
MFSTLLTVALFVAPAIQGVFAEFSISTPDLVQCKSAKISWEETTAPYNLIVVSPEDPCGDALVDVGDFNKSSISWTPNLPAGTLVQLSLEDANGDEAWSGNITIAASDDESCLAPEFRSNSTSSSAVSGSATVLSGTTYVSAATASGSVAPVGAANAGTNPLSNSGVALRQLSTPVMALSAIAAGIALCI